MVPYELLLVHFHGEQDTSQKRDEWRFFLEWIGWSITQEQISLIFVTVSSYLVHFTYPNFMSSLPGIVIV